VAASHSPDVRQQEGISTRQIQRMLVCSMKTAWFLTHRIRAAMASGDLSLLGGNGATVEIDETVIGRQEGSPRRAHAGARAINGNQFRNIVLTLSSAAARPVAGMWTAPPLALSCRSFAPTSRRKPPS